MRHFQPCSLIAVPRCAAAARSVRREQAAAGVFFPAGEERSLDGGGHGWFVCLHLQGSCRPARLRPALLLPRLKPKCDVCRALSPRDAGEGLKRGRMEEMAPVSLPEKEGGAPACGPRRRHVRPAAGVGAWSHRQPEGRDSICLFTSTQKYFPPFQNGAFHLLISKQLGKTHYLSHPADKGLDLTKVA